MEKLIEFKDRQQLYKSLENLSIEKIKEDYYPDIFGNYSITFSVKQFLIRYVSDRSQLTIYIASNFAPSKWLPLSFVKNFINKDERIAVEEGFNLKSILELNDFLKNHLNKIAELLSEDNYKNTFNQINTLLRQEHRI